MYISKKLKKMIAASLTVSGLTLMPAVVPAFYPINTIVDLPIVSVTHAKVTTYTGVGEDYANEYESQEIAKQRARSKAIRQATEQAGVYLQTYSKSINGRITNDEINAITSNSYKIDGEPVYERIVQQVTNVSTVIIWKATVQVNVDDAEIQDWLKLNSMDRSTIVNQNNILQESIAANDKQVENLRQRAMNASTDEERAQIRAEYQQVDSEFLANQLLEEGNRLAYQGDYNGAVAKYNEALQYNPNDVIAYNNRGNAYADLQNYEAAIMDYNKAIELNPNLSEAYNNRGLTYAYMGNYNEAIADLTKAIELNPNYAAAYNNRGNTYDEMGNHNAAINDYNKAIELNPNNADYYNNRGVVYTKMSNYTQAITDYNKAIELNPNDDYAYNNRGVAYQELKQYKKALVDYNKALTLMEHPLIYANRGEVHYYLKNYKQAIDDLNKAIELGIEGTDLAEALYYRGLAYEKLGDNTRAQADFDKAKQLGYTE